MQRQTNTRCYMEEFQMPTTIILHAEMLSTDSAIRKGLREAQDAYRELRLMEDLGEVPEPLKCTKEWIDGITQSKKQAIRNAEFLTAGQKVSQHLNWGKISTKAIALINTIQDFLASVPNEQYVHDPQIGNFHLRDISEIARSRCTRDVPPEAATHYALIRNIEEAIKSLRVWEKQQDVKKLPLKHLLALPCESVASIWSHGDIIVDHSFDHLPHVVENRELEEREIL